MTEIGRVAEFPIRGFGRISFSLTAAGVLRILSDLSDSSPTPFLQTVRWLAAYAGFPATRLPERAELLLLIATAGAGENLETSNPYHVGMLRNPNFAAEIRNYTAMRRRVHLKCDNSAKS